MSDALQRLIEAVEAGHLGWNAIASMCEDAGIGLIEAKIAANAYTGSLDAAKALHDALLPGWHRELCDFFVRLRCGPKMGFADVRDGNLGRAWLLAILRAYQQVQQ